jgi:hypothetical protein
VGAARSTAIDLRGYYDPGRAETYVSGEVRREKDLLGERDVPAANYYGIQTQRAVENFPITGIPIAQFPHLIKALAAVKEASAAGEPRARPARPKSPTPSSAPAARSAPATCTTSSSST